MTRRHIHECDHDCGRSYVCDPELCPGNWTCPICEQADRDRYYSRLEPNPQPTRTAQGAVHEKQ